MYNDFYSDLEDGKRGERIVAAALAARGHTITDLSDNYEARQKDIDFALKNRSGAETTLEVKNDIKSESTGNLFIETYNIKNQSHSYKGWFFYCEAQYICFLQEQHKAAHIVSFDDLRATIAAKAYRTANSSNASGYLLPLDDLKTCNSYFLLEV